MARRGQEFNKKSTLMPLVHRGNSVMKQKTREAFSLKIRSERDHEKTEKVSAALKP